jgi:hypothetical protein
MAGSPKEQVGRFVLNLLRTLEDLRLARDLSRRVGDGDDGVARSYG